MTFAVGTKREVTTIVCHTDIFLSRRICFYGNILGYTGCWAVECHIDFSHMILVTSDLGIRKGGKIIIRKIYFVFNVQAIFNSPCQNELE